MSDGESRWFSSYLFRWVGHSPVPKCMEWVTNDDRQRKWWLIYAKCFGFLSPSGRVRMNKTRWATGVQRTQNGPVVHTAYRVISAACMPPHGRCHRSRHHPKTDEKKIKWHLHQQQCWAARYWWPLRAIFPCLRQKKRKRERKREERNWMTFIKMVPEMAHCRHFPSSIFFSRCVQLRAVVIIGVECNYS